ncbi:Helicase IV [compost metagenome]
MIDEGHKIEPFNRDGAEPTLTQIKDPSRLMPSIASRLQELEGAGYQSIAVICKTAAESNRMYMELKAHLPHLRLIEKETATFEKGLTIIPSYLAKGVEFDAVIISNASSSCYGRESERKLFYTACTRAMHELHLYYVGELTPFIE